MGLLGIFISREEYYAWAIPEYMRAHGFSKRKAKYHAKCHYDGAQVK